MIVVDAGYTLIVELFFLNMRTYFFLKYHMDTLGSSFIIPKGLIFVLLDKQKTAYQSMIYFLYGIPKYPQGFN